MNNPEFYEKYKNKSQREIDSSFVSACMFGHLADVRYLLNSEDLAIKPNLYVFNGMALQYACYYGHLEVAKYLLTSSELKEPMHLNWHKKPSELVEQFIDSGNLEAIKFFISKKFKDTIKLSKVIEYTFNNINETNMNIVSYFIFDLNIKRTKPIEKILLEKPNEEVEKMFALRHTNQILNTDLVINKMNPKKIKI